MAYNPPSALTATGWDLFNSEFKQRAPVRYLLSKVIMRKIRHIKYSLKRNYIDFIDKYIARSDCLHIGTGLHTDTRYDVILYASFSYLTTLVERDYAWRFHTYGDELRNTIKWYERNHAYYRLFYRNPAYGINYLKQCMEYNDPSNPQDTEVYVKQATETLELYLWWKERANRKSLLDGLTYSDQGYEMGVLDARFDKTAPDYQAYRDIYDQQTSIEETWDQEDDAMLARLISVRHKLD